MVSRQSNVSSFLQLRLFSELAAVPSGFYCEYLRDSCSTLRRLELSKRLAVHRGCVNTVTWSDDGRFLLSGSDDHYLVINDCFNESSPVAARIASGHNANIFCARFLPCSNNDTIVSCSGDGVIIITDVARTDTYGQNILKCHVSTTYELATIPRDPNNFISCGEDGTVRLFDRRVKMHCIPCREDVLIDCKRAACAVDVNKERLHMLAVGCSDGTARLYDMRMLSRQGVASANMESSGDDRSLCGMLSYFCVPDLGTRTRRVTSIDFSHDGQELLVSFSSGNIYLIDVDHYNEGKVELPTDDAEGSAVKRVRLRGDWSDTGPQSRPTVDTPSTSSNTHTPPVAERSDESLMSSSSVRHTSAAVMQRFTQLLSRWLERQITGESDTEEANEDDEENSPAQEPVEEVASNTIEQVNDMVSQLDIDGPSQSLAKENISASAQSSTSIASQETGPESTVEISLEDGTNLKTKNDAVSDENVPSGSGSSAARALGVAEQQPQQVNDNDIAVDVIAMRTDCVYDPNSHSVNVHREEEIADFSAKIDVKLNVSLQGACCSTLHVQVQPEEIDDSSETMEDDDLSSSSVETGGSSVSELGRGMTGFRVRQGRRSGGLLVEAGEQSEDHDPESANRIIRRRAIVSKLEEEAKKRQNKRLEMLQQLQQLPQNRCKMIFSGHRNVRTMLKQASFWGARFVLSGCDSGHIFAWDKQSGEVVHTFEADKHVVNCLQPHPYYLMLASSGIDYDVKLWLPTSEESRFDENKTKELVQRNERMLEETKDTVTVPAAFMIRMLASMNRSRRNAQDRQRRAANNN